MHLNQWTPIALLFLAASCGSTAVNQDAASDPDMFASSESGVTPELMAEVMRLAKPGEEHVLLAKYEGEFDQEVRMWMTPSALEPMVMKGECTNKMILDGRFLQTNSKTTGGMFNSESLSILGHDRRSDEFTTIGFDSMGTYSVSAQGPRGEDGIVVMYGEDYEPTFNATQKYNFVLHFIDDDTYMVQIVFLDTNHGNTDPYKMVEVVNTRKAQ